MVSGLCWDMMQEQRLRFVDCATNNACYPSEGRARGRFNEAERFRTVHARQTVVVGQQGCVELTGADPRTDLSG